MSAYMGGVLACAAAAAIIGMICPSGADTGKYIKYIMGLVTLCVIASPLVDLIASVRDLPDIEIAVSEPASEYDAFGAVLDEAARTLSDAAASAISERFGIDSADISVSAHFTGGDIYSARLEAVTVTLRADGVWANVDAIADYIRENYDCEAYIEYE